MAETFSIDEFPQLLNAIIGLMAYDQGCVDSGIHDPGLKQKCQNTIERFSSSDGDPLLKLFTAYVHEITAPDSPYTLEDVHSFIEYLDHEFGWSL